MKVLLVSSSFYPKVDGSTRCVYDHARKLAERGHDVTLATRGVPGAPRLQKVEGFRVERTSVSFRSGSVVSKAMLLLEQVLAILRLQRAKGFDVIHVHGYISGLAALPCKYLFGVPVVITTHGTELLWPKDLWWKGSTEVRLGLLFEKFVLSRCDVVIAQSPGVKEYMLRIYGRGIESKIAMVHTGVDEQKFHVSPIITPTRQVMFVGALSEIKGVSCLIRAFAKARKDFPQAKLVLVGSGPRMGNYKQMVDSLGVKDAVSFVGALRDDGRLIEMYSRSDAVVLPSNVGGPISCTILEGLSCGRAVISTDVPGGIPDVLGGGVGLLMHRGDEDALATYLSHLFEDNEYLVSIGEGARRAVEMNYTLESMATKLESVYAGVVH